MDELIPLNNIPGIPNITFEELQEIYNIYNLSLDEENVENEAQILFEHLIRVPRPFSPIIPFSLLRRLRGEGYDPSVENDRIYLDTALRSLRTFRSSDSVFADKLELRDYTIGLAKVVGRSEYTFSFLFVIPSPNLNERTLAWPLVIDPLSNDLFILDMSLDFMADELSNIDVDDLLHGDPVTKYINRDSTRLRLSTLSWPDIDNGVILNLSSDPFAFEGDRYAMIGEKFDFNYLNEKIEGLEIYNRTMERIGQ